MNINDHRDDIADLIDAHDYTTSLGGQALCTCGWPESRKGIATDLQTAHRGHLADSLLASPALARLLAAARGEARAESETPADVLDGTGVTANTWQSAARRLADENRALLSAFDQLRRTLNEIRGGTR